MGMESPRCSSPAPGQERKHKDSGALQPGLLLLDAARPVPDAAGGDKSTSGATSGSYRERSPRPALRGRGDTPGYPSGIVSRYQEAKADLHLDGPWELDVLEGHPTFFIMCCVWVSVCHFLLLFAHFCFKHLKEKQYIISEKLQTV